MTARTFDHVGFTVTDLDRSVAWYGYFLNAEPLLRDVWDVDYIGDMVGIPGCRMECAYFPLPGGAKLELIQYLSPPSTSGDLATNTVGNAHLCLVVSDIHAEYDRMEGRASFRSPTPVRITWGPYKGGWGAYLIDPDGISIQLMQYANDRDVSPLA